MSFASHIEDDGSPGRALTWARWAMRDFVHRSDTPMHPSNPGWDDPREAHQALGELVELVHALPQALVRINAALRDQLQRGRLGFGYGSRFEGNPRAAVDAAGAALEQASEAAQRMALALAAAHDATRHAMLLRRD